MKNIVSAIVIISICSTFSCSDDPVVPVGENQCDNTDYSLTKGKADWTWQKTDRGDNFNAVAYDGYVYLAVGDRSVIKSSAEGVHWRTVERDSDDNILAVVDNRGEFVAVGDGPYARVISGTEPNLQLTRYETGQQNQLRDISRSQRVILAVGKSGEVLTTQNGRDWVRASPITGENLWGSLDSGEWTYVVGDNGTLFKTKDGQYWIEWATGLEVNFRAMAIHGGRYVVVTDDGSVFTTVSEEAAWDEYVVAPGKQFYDVVWAYDRFVTVGEGGIIGTSRTGTCWDVFETGITNDFNGLCWGDKVVVAGARNTILLSRDGNEWESRPSAPDFALDRAIYASDKYVAVGQYGKVLSSTDMQQWEPIVPNIAPWTWFHDVCFTGTYIVAVGSYGAIYRSQNGINWVEIDSGITSDLWTIHWSGDHIIAGGSNHVLAKSVNGDVWTIQQIPGSEAVFRFAQSDSLVVAATARGAFLSENWNDWIPPTHLISRVEDVVWDGKNFVAVTTRSVFASSDGMFWTREVLGDNVGLDGVATNGSETVVVGATGAIFSKTPAGPWVSEESGMSPSPYFRLTSVSWTNGGFVVTGDKGTILTRSRR
jgi:hypothetical protein